MSPRSRLAALFVAFALATVACGLTPNDDPEVIQAADVPFSLLEPELSTTTTEPATQATQSFAFYLVQQTDEGTLVEPVTREVPLSPSPTDIVSRLLTLDPTEGEEADGLSTRIPEDVTLLDVELDASQGLLTLDFSENLFDVAGEFQTSMFAQIVWTATGLEGVSRISFRIDGEPIEVRVGDSSVTTEPVDRADYNNFRPTDPASATTTTTTSRTETTSGD